MSSETLKTQCTWLGLYFFFNLALTLFNKAVLGSFPFPYTLTGIHTLCGTLGCALLHWRGVFKLTRLSDSESTTLILFSILYTINIAISNVSLQMVTVPFHQVVRATTPFFAMLINVLFLRHSYTVLTYLSLVLVCAGVGFATAGDYYFTAMGFILTILGAVLAAVKTVVTNRIQTGRFRLSPLELLYRMSPLAFVQTIVYAYLAGELEVLGLRLSSPEDVVGATAAAGSGPLSFLGGIDYTEIEFEYSQKLMLHLLLNGIIAFGLNIVSFTTNKKTGALTMTVAANVKQILTIVLAIFFFNLTVTPLNCMGILVTLLGGAWYAKLELDRKSDNSGAHEALPTKEDNSRSS